MSQSQDTSWLVKSSGVILGPYSLEQVIQGLSEKRIAIIDEVKSPTTRWKFIREHSQFANIVQFLREQENQAKEDTGTTFVGSRTVTQTISKTADMDPAPSLPSKYTEEVKPVPISKPVQYASPTDPRVLKNVRRKNRSWALLTWVLLLCVIGGGALLYRNTTEETSKSLSYQDYIRLAKSNQAIGNYERSLEFLKKANAINSQEMPGRLLLAPMMMIVENQNIQARQVIEQAIENLKSSDQERIEAESLVALSYLREGQLEEAEKQYQNILSQKSEYEPALINLQEIYILKGEFSTAYENLTKLMKESIKDPCLILYRSLVTYRIFSEETGKDKLIQSLQDLSRFRQKFYDYTPETLLLQAAIQKKLGLEAEVKDSMAQLISTYPDLTKDHHHDYLIHREILGWKYLANICDILREGSDAKSSTSLAFSSYCNYQQGNLKGALDQIDEAALQSPKEVSFYGLRAFLLFKSGRIAEAKAISSLPGSETSKALKIVEAQICEAEKNTNCAEEKWQEVLLKEEGNIQALSGLARLALDSGNKELATDFAMRASLKSSNYKPLLEIKDQLDQR